MPPTWEAPVVALPLLCRSRRGRGRPRPNPHRLPANKRELRNLPPLILENGRGGCYAGTGFPSHLEAVGEPAAGMVVTVRPQAPARPARRLPAKAKAFRV